MAVFFNRCRPQGFDAIQLVQDTSRVFIGYPLQIAGAPYDPHNLTSCIANPAAPNDVWAACYTAGGGRAQNTMNRNLVAEVQVGDIFMVPRPNRGVVYCGRVVNDAALGVLPFQLIGNPPWYDHYMALRGGVDDSETRHAGDVCQSWQLDDVVPIPFPLIPAWMRRSLLGRSTYGRIHADPELGDPHAIVENLLQGNAAAQRPWTTDRTVIAHRLLQDIGPSTFEHLVVALLQLAHPDQIWAQIGGSGDGGIDGIGSTPGGHVTSLLQCKWQYWGGNPFSADVVWPEREQPFTRILASLRHPPDVQIEGVMFLGRAEIAECIAQHHARLPWAIAMRVGVEPAAEAVA